MDAAVQAQSGIVFPLFRSGLRMSTLKHEERAMFVSSYRQIARIVFLALALLCAGTATAQQNRQTGKLFGVVTDRAAKTPLYGASVSVADTKLGIMADENGRYVIDQIPPGTYNIRFSMIGYKTLVKTDVTITPGRETEISVSLDQDAIEVEGVVVQTKESYFEKNPEAEVSGRTMDTSEILEASGGMGDVQRVVQVLPSVVSGSDQFNEIIVRGGNYNENLFVMDGIEIPNPNHFAYQGAGGGPISLLRTEFIRSVDFFAGAFPAKYGDKASSVMDISLRSGSREKFMKNIDMGMAGIGVMAEGPVSDRGSFLFSARKSYLDLIISDFGITAIPHYYNFQGKLTYELSDRHTLLWNTVYGSDKIEIRPDENEDDPEDDDNVNSSSNLLVSGFTLTSTLSQSLLSRAVLSFVKNTWREDVWELGKTKSDMYYNNRSKESEITLKYDLSWFLGKHELSGGFSLKNSRFNHDIFAEQDTVYTYDTSFVTAGEDTITGIYRTYPDWHDDKNVSTLKSAAFLQARLQPFSRLTLRLGGRYDHVAYTGHGDVAPRIGLRYRVTDKLWLNGGYGIHYQSPSYIQISAHENNKHLDNYRTDQFVIGPEWLPRPDTRVTLEAYTKRYRDVPVATSWTTPDPWDSSNGELVNAAKGHSEGVELYLHRKMSTSYMYILSYSFYRAWFEDPRTKEERPWDFDHRNVFTASFAKRWRPENNEWYRGLRSKTLFKAFAWILPIGDEVLLSTRWRFTGGRPYTGPRYLRENHVWIIPEDTKYNTMRFSDYHRLDIRIDGRYYFKNWSLVTYFDIMNVYGRKNIWDYARDEYGEVDKVYQFSTMPIGGFSIEF